MMQIEFEVKDSDYLNFIKAYFFKRALIKKIIVSIALAFWCAVIGEQIGSIVPSILFFKFIAFFCAIFLLMVVIPYFLAKRKFQKVVHVEFKPALQKITLTDNWIIIATEQEETIVKWHIIKTCGHSGEYLFIHLLSGKFYIIPYHVFTSKQAASQFLKIIEDSIQKDQTEIRKAKIKKLHYYGLLGFIPNVGFVAGIILLAKGVQYKKTSLIWIGIGGLLFTPLFWFVTLRFMFKN